MINDRGRRLPSQDRCRGPVPGTQDAPRTPTFQATAAELVAQVSPGDTVDAVTLAEDFDVIIREILEPAEARVTTARTT